MTFTTANSLTNNEQYYTIFGLHNGPVQENTIGSRPFANIDIADIDKSKHSFDLTITAPKLSGTKENLTAAVFGEVGESGVTTLQYFTNEIETIPSN